MSKINPDFKESFELLGPAIVKNCKVLTPDMLDVPLLFRVDETLPKVFIPSMPRSAATSENSSVPRVVTATTLIGCMCGHSGMLYCALDRDVGTKPNSLFKISAFDFEVGLLPNAKLVYDATETQEAWLITYNKATVVYKPFDYGELFFHKVTTVITATNAVNKTFADILIKVIDDRGLPLFKDVMLAKGFYYLKLDLSTYALIDLKNGVKRMSYQEKEKVQITSVSEAVYKSLRSISVAK